MKSIPNTLPAFLWHYAKRYKFYLFGLVMVALYWAVNISLKPYAMKLIIDGATKWDKTESLFSLLMYPALLYIIVSLLLGCAFRFFDWFLLKTFPDMRRAMIEETFDYVEKNSYNYFQDNFAGSIGNKINDIAKSGVKVIITLLDYFLPCILGIIIGATTMFFVHPVFACVLVVWTIIFSIASILLSIKAQTYSEIYSNARSTAVGKVVDSIGNILNVKLFSRESFEKNYLSHYLEDTASKERNGNWYLLKVKAFYAITVTILLASMLFLLIYEYSKNSITVGDFALILTLNMFLIDEVFRVAMELVSFSDEVGNCKQALSIISSKHEITDIPGAKPLQISSGKIVFDKVHFKYKKGQSVFTDKSITINPGQKIGLVGFSGSGKSTFVNLILRFFEVDSGTILIDDQDIKTVTQQSLRESIAMIPQDPALFHRTLLENIRYGRLNATDEEIIECSKKAHCHEFVEKLEDGYQSLVGERGVKLSGGQRQRIAIARAILKNAPILILDEATSSLDSVTESYIQDSLSKLMEGRTTIVIAHRLSTLFHMDRILVFRDGKITEDGNHTDLIALNGHYAKLWSMQAGGFLGV
jgi:ATP-binding cassette subfamily B protein